MVHGYHVIFGAYIFWLPNDPRGSWSDFVGSWELVRFGRATKSTVRKPLSSAEETQRVEAKCALRYASVQFTCLQSRAVANGFENACRKTGLPLWACSILAEHVHSVIARVEENPAKEGKPRQSWRFVTPSGGIVPGGWITDL